MADITHSNNPISEDYFSYNQDEYQEIFCDADIDIMYLDLEYESNLDFENDGRDFFDEDLSELAELEDLSLSELEQDAFDFDDFDSENDQ